MQKYTGTIDSLKSEVTSHWLLDANGRIVLLHVLFLVLFPPVHMAAVVIGSVSLQQFKALPGGLVGPWALFSVLVLFFALVSQPWVTQKSFLLQASI